MLFFFFFVTGAFDGLDFCFLIFNLETFAASLGLSFWNRCEVACATVTVTNSQWTMMIRHHGTGTAVPSAPSTPMHSALIQSQIGGDRRVRGTSSLCIMAVVCSLFLLPVMVNRVLLGPTAHVKRWACLSQWGGNEVTVPLSCRELVRALLAPPPPPSLLILFSGNPPTLFPSREET